MIELVRSNDLVHLSWAVAMLEAEGIACLLLDAHVSAVEGNIGVFPRRLLVAEEDQERARAVLPDQLPHVAEREQDPPQVALAAGILQAALVDFAAKNKLAPNLVASTQDVKNLARARLQGEPPAPGAPLTRGWRAEFVLPHLQAVLEGRRAIRIADLRREAPLDYVDSES